MGKDWIKPANTNESVDEKVREFVDRAEEESANERMKRVESESAGGHGLNG